MITPRSGHFNPEKSTDDWMGPKADRDGCGKQENLLRSLEF